MLLIGLTGGIASGKTLVSDAFAELGAPVIDADLLAREVVEPGSKGLTQLAEHFGNTILSDDQTLNRPALRTIIFADPAQRKTVDAILHPLIRDLSEQRIKAAATQNNAYAVYAIPLLLETNQVERFDRIAVVDVPKEIQIERLMARDETTREKAASILAAQANREERLAIADDIIDNTGSKIDTLAQVNRLHEHYIKLSTELN